MNTILFKFLKDQLPVRYDFVREKYSKSTYK